MDSLLNTYLTLLKMSENDPRYESMLFNYETTAKNDFRNGALLGVKRTVYTEKPKCLRVRPPPLKDIHTLTDWKTPYVPIDLLVKPKEVVRTDPRKPQEKYLPVEDTEKELVRATRPRLVMTPAVSMDDIADDRKRELLTKEMYKTTAKLSAESGIAAIRDRRGSVQAPLTGEMSGANPVKLEKLQFPYVSPEWRMPSAAWDGRQLRAHCDPSAEFYLARTPKCDICDETAAREERKKKMMKMKLD